MEKQIIDRVQSLREEMGEHNAFGEPIVLVAATKMQTADAINAAIVGGVDAVAENKAQEFRDKYAKVLPCPRHFIGHLQTNKLKYLVGNIHLFHSCDRDEIAMEIARLSLKKEICSNILIQVNIGKEESKSGYALSQAKEAYLRLREMDGICVKGFMAMLPVGDDENYLRGLVRQMRGLFEWAKAQSSTIEYLSMGMSGDYMLCIQEGSNMVRVGTTIFGARTYA